jgi:Cupin superfamily protein
MPATSTIHPVGSDSVLGELLAEFGNELARLGLCLLAQATNGDHGRPGVGELLVQHVVDDRRGVRVQRRPASAAVPPAILHQAAVLGPANDSLPSLQFHEDYECKGHVDVETEVGTAHMSVLLGTRHRKIVGTIAPAAIGTIGPPRVADYLVLRNRMQASLAGRPEATTVSPMITPSGLLLEPGEVLVVDQPDAEAEAGYMLRPRMVLPTTSDACRRSLNVRASAQANFALQLASALWMTVLGAGGLMAPRPVHVKGLIDSAALKGWPVPTAADHAAAQLIGLCEGTVSRTETPPDDETLALAYAASPRTRVAENISAYSGGPYALAVPLLAELARCRVLCDVFESAAGDRSFVRHSDLWLSGIFQVEGAKRWLLWPDLTGGPQEVVLTAGDALIMPPGIPHEVSTPKRSVHALYAMLIDQPLTASADRPML